MAATAGGRGSRHGINGAILEAGLGSIGTVLETDTPEAGRRTPDIGNSASGARRIQSWAAGTQEGFPRCRTPSEAVGGPRIESELCARPRTEALADGGTPKISADAEPGTVTEPNREPLEEAHIKLSSFVSDLLGLSAQRMLKALSDGETNPAALAALADRKLHATQEQLRDALGACTELNPVYRRLLGMMLEELRLIDEQIGQLNQEMANLLNRHQDAVERLAEVPGLGVDSAQQIIAEVGATAATFPSAKQLSSWVGACPGEEESAGVNYSHRSPKGNRNMRRILNQAANAAVKAKGTIFEIVYRRMVLRLGHKQTIGVVAHRQCLLIWKVLHDGVRYEERGPAVTKESKQRRTAKMIRQLRTLGYRVEPANPQPPKPT